MIKIVRLLSLSLTTFALIAINYLSISLAEEKPPLITDHKSLLSDPFLQLPTKTTVNVVWFTEFLGDNHVVTYGEGFQHSAIAKTTKLMGLKQF